MMRGRETAEKRFTLYIYMYYIHTRNTRIGCKMREMDPAETKVLVTSIFCASADSSEQTYDCPVVKSSAYACRGSEPVQRS
jgi:hypothetical protein